MLCFLCCLVVLVADLLGLRLVWFGLVWNGLVVVGLVDGLRLVVLLC